MPRVSVLLPVYNAAPYLADALASLEPDLGPDVEVVAVNDGSTDNSGEILERWSYPRRTLVHQANTGLVGALQTAAGHGTGELFARMDADDRNLPGRLPALRQLLDAQQDVVLAATWQRQIDGTGRIVHPGYRFAWDPAAIDRALYVTNALSHGPTMFRRAAYERSGGYLPSMCEDLHLWDRMSDLGAVTMVPRVLYEYRVDVDSLMSRNAVQVAAAAEQIKQARWERRPPSTHGIYIAVARYRFTSSRSIHRAHLRELGARARQRGDRRRFASFAAAYVAA